MSDLAARVELTPPDIEPYRAGNTGVDYVMRFEAAEPGPHVLVCALTHGNEICGAIVRGEAVKLSSFGSFIVRKKGERVGRNPKTGEEVPISPRRVMVFKPSNVLKQKINHTLLNGGSEMPEPAEET